MRTNRQRVLWLGISIFAVLTLPSASLGQASPEAETAFPVTTDWSYHHVVYSRPATGEQTERLKQDPRYLQQISHHSDVMLPEPVPEAQLGPIASLFEENQKSNGFWEEDLGNNGSVGAINYPAKYSFKTNVANCASDFVVFATGLVGSAQASIAAFNNLYSGCGGTVPSVYWAYDTGANIKTSPIFSLDGTQMTFVQTNSLGHGILVLLRWAPSGGSITSPVSLTRVSHALYPSCIAPCMTTLVLPAGSTGALDSDTASSVFYDYSNDTAYVGDGSGYLHKFNPFFLGVPTEVRGAWPVLLNPGSPTALNEPVHDYASGNVFVTDNGGFLYRVDPAGGVTTSGQLDFSVLNDGGPGIVQGAIIDSSAGLAYVFAPSDGTAACAGGADCAGVYELSTSFSAGDFGSEAVVGNSTVAGTAAPSPLYIGAFDSTYENSADPPTGNLYVCGNTGGPAILYQVPISVGAFGTPIPGPVLSNGAATITPCSPVSDIFNPNVSSIASEWIYASVQSVGTWAACSGGGCLFSFNSTPWKASTAYSVGQEVLDDHLNINVVTNAGTSGTTTPRWSTNGHTTSDGTVTWLEQGAESGFMPAAWVASHAYSKSKRILDPNGNIEIVTSPATGTALSGTSIPTFSTAPGGTTTDGTGTLVWTNIGAIATAALPAAGGTSGIIIDNTVTTPAGTSQIYFSTLSNQSCGTGTGGCAIQASQSGLK